MKRIGLKIFSIAMLMGAVAYAQSLGDVARENREKQQAKAASASSKPKVITNDNLPASVEAASSETEGKLKPVSTLEASAPSPERLSAEDWKSRILTQKNAIAAQQAEIDKLNESIHYVTASLYTNGIQHNENQAKKQEAVAQMQRQLEEQKKNLAQMQDAARQAGMGSAGYDP